MKAEREHIYSQRCSRSSSLDAVIETHFKNISFLLPPTNTIVRCLFCLHHKAFFLLFSPFCWASVRSVYFAGGEEDPSICTFSSSSFHALHTEFFFICLILPSVLPFIHGRCFSFSFLSLLLIFCRPFLDVRFLPAGCLKSCLPSDVPMRGN